MGNDSKIMLALCRDKLHLLSLTPKNLISNIKNVSITKNTPYSNDCKVLWSISQPEKRWTIILVFHSHIYGWKNSIML